MELIKLEAKKNYPTEYIYSMSLAEIETILSIIRIGVKHLALFLEETDRERLIQIYLELDKAFGERYKEGRERELKKFLNEVKRVKVLNS